MMNNHTTLIINFDLIANEQFEIQGSKIICLLDYESSIAQTFGSRATNHSDRDRTVLQRHDC